MTTNDTIGIEMPAENFFEIVRLGMNRELLDNYNMMKDRRVEDVVITDDDRYRIVYGQPVDADKQDDVS